MQTKHALAVIPARGGSKRLPRKNAKLLGEKPLVAHAIESAIYSECFDKIILSSDDDEILQIGSGYPDVTPERRSDKMSGDHVKALDLILQIAERDSYDEKFDVIALLLPTCPFRQPSDVRDGLGLLTEDVDAVVSVVEFEFPHNLYINVDAESAMMNPSEGLRTGNTRSQDHGPTYHPNGAFYMSWWKPFLTNRNWFVGKVRAYPMPRLRSVDIDTEQDMAYAQFLLDSKAIELENVS